MKELSRVGLKLVMGASAVAMVITSFVLAEETDKKALRLEPRPRLFLDKATKASLQEFIRQHPDDETWQSAKGGMLGWQLAGDREAGRRAVEGALKQAKQWNANPPQPGTGFSHTSTAEAMAYALDWCYELLTPEEKAEIVKCGNDAAWGCLKGYCGIKPDYKGGPLPGSLYNHMTTRQLGALLWGIAAHGEGQDADFFFGHCYKVLKEGMVPVYQPWVAGGAMWEGGDYGWADFSHTLQMMLAVKSATGEDLRQVINLADRIPFFIHATRPTGDCSYFQGHAWSNNGITGTLYPRYRGLMALFAHAYPEVGVYVPTYFKRTLLDEASGGALDEMLTKLGFPEPKDYEVDWPPSYHAKALGVVLARSRWADPDATHLSFICGPYIHYYSDQDQGHFEIFKRRRLVTDIRDRDCYMDSTLPSCYHNTIVMGELGEPKEAPWRDGPTSGGQRGCEGLGPAVGKITALEDDYANYLYVCGDLTGAYLEDRIENYTRQIVFVRPDYAVVFDRVASPTADWRKRFFLYLWNKPEAEGEYLAMKNGPSKVLIRTLLPREPVVKVIGPGYAGKGERRWSHPETSYHLEIEPKEKAKEARFLHFFKAGDVEAKAAPQCELVEKEGETGLKFTDGEYQCLVAFRTQGPAGGHISIRRGSQTVVDRDLTREVVSPPLLLPSAEQARQRETVAKLRASRTVAALVVEETKVSDKSGEEFEFSGLAWVNLGNARITKTADGTLRVLTREEKPDGITGMRTKSPLNFPVRIEVKGKIRSYNDRIGFGLCDENGIHAIGIWAGAETGTRVYWTTRRSAQTRDPSLPKTGWAYDTSVTGGNDTYVNEPMLLDVFYRIQCNLSSEANVPFKGVILNEEGQILGWDRMSIKEPEGLPYAHPQAKYLFLGQWGQAGKMSQVGWVKVEAVAR